MASATATVVLRAPVEIANPSTQATRVFAASSTQVKVAPKTLTVCAQSKSEASQSRRSVLSLLAATVAAGSLVSEARAVSSIKIEGPPPPIGGLPGTDSADQARDTDAPLKERFYIQPLSPAEAAVRAKESAQQIADIKGLIDKKAWPYVQNDLRSKAGYLRYDLTTVVNSKPKAEKKELTALANQLYDSIADLDYAARSKNPAAAYKSYDKTVALLNEVLANLV